MGRLSDENSKYVMEKVLITVLDSVGPTSMPFNEFVLWRAKHCVEEKQILIVIGGGNVEPIGDFGNRLEVIRLGWNPFLIRKKVKQLLMNLRQDNRAYSIHLHQLKSATIIQLSMLGTGFRKKTIFTVHSTFSGYALHNKIQSYFNGLMARNVACVSETSYAKYPASLKKNKGDRIFAIRNGVDVDRIDSVLSESVCNKEKGIVQFIYVARIIPLKNHSFLVEAIKDTNPQAHFLFVGKECDGSIKNLIKEAGLEDRIKLTGLITRKEVFELLNNADVYVSSSTLEGMPISVLEAMYCKLPAILSNIPQHQEIGGNESYVSYLPFDKKAWAKEINKYVEMSEDERRNRGEEGKKYVEANFSLRAMHQRYTEKYNILRKC